MIGSNYISILRYLKENSSCLEKIIEGLNNDFIDVKLNIALFLIELLNCSKQVQGEEPKQFFTQQITENLLRLLLELLSHKEDLHREAVTLEDQVKRTMKAVIDSVAIMIDTTYAEEKDYKLKVYVSEILAKCFPINPSKILHDSI